MLLAFIPARKGSKGVPGKNLKLLNGKPLIQYTIEAALASRFVDRILVSTDDQAVVELAHTLGVGCGYRRPDELASDSTSMFDTVEHGLAWFEEHAEGRPDEVILLQPTSPLRTAVDIDASVEMFRSGSADSLISVHEMAEHPNECVVNNPDGWRYLITPPENAVRRQDYDAGGYFINGAIYLWRTIPLLTARTFVDVGKSLLYQMPRERGVDIDEPLDFIYAEAILKHGGL